MIPKQLGPYEIKRLLGQGGMGAVFLGVHKETGQQAGVKTLSAALSRDEDFRERFAGEIESLKKLRHPHIVQLFGWGEQDETLFYAMEYVEGQNLQERLASGDRIEWQEVIRIAIDVCKALKHAHDNGIIHRDLKPANLLIDGAGQVKLTDFGIAKLFGQTQLTIEGGVVGTADFMAPEQALGKTVTHRCDLYSLGSVMYTLLAGRPPFLAKSMPEVVHKVCYEPPQPLRRFNGSVPPPLEALIAELLEKDPQRRPPTARSLTTRLEAMQHGLTESKPRAKHGRRAAEETEFDVSDPSATVAPSTPQVHSATTRFAPPEDEASPGEKTSTGLTVAGKTSRSPSALTDAPRGERTVHGEQKDGSSTADAAKPQTTGEGRFTTIEDEATAAQRDAAAGAAAGRWVIAGLVAVLLGVLAFSAWQALVPPSADRLYEQISAVALSDSEELSTAGDDIQQFLALYPNDPRHDEITGYQEEIELDRLQRNFERRGRRLNAATELTPVERAYLDAVETGRSRPEEAVAKLQAIVDVYGQQGDASRSTKQVVDLAGRQLLRLRTAADESGKAHLEELRQSLATAKERQATDPQAAAAIYRGIVLLYQDKPWAAEVVAAARQGMVEK